MKARDRACSQKPLVSDGRLFPDDWLLKFDGPYERIHAVAKTYLEQALKNETPLKASHHIEAAMLGKQFVYNEGLPLMAGFPHFKAGGLTPQARDYVITMHEWLRDYSAVRLEREAVEKAEALGEHFQALLGRSLGYELTERQLIELRGSVNELQAKIAASHELREHRRERLLQRLEQLQLELHTKISSMDRLYGTMMEVFALAQNLGEEAKSLVEIAAKIFGLVWAVQSQRDGSGVSQTIVPFPLPPPERSEIPVPLPVPLGINCSRVNSGRHSTRGSSVVASLPSSLKQ